MDLDWDIAMFGAIWIGLFVVLPICVFLLIRVLFKGRTRRAILTVAAAGGIAIGLGMCVTPFANPPTHSGGLGILILVPLGLLLASVCAALMWKARRLSD